VIDRFQLHKTNVRAESDLASNSITFIDKNESIIKIVIRVMLSSIYACFYRYVAVFILNSFNF
jgi:hypothetical protein